MNKPKIQPEAIKAIRETLGLTPWQFADIGTNLGYPIASSDSTVMRWERLGAPTPLSLLLTIIMTYPEVRRDLGLMTETERKQLRAEARASKRVFLEHRRAIRAVSGGAAPVVGTNPEAQEMKR